MWITHIWSKPLVQWSLLDIIGLIGLMGIAVAIWFVWVIVTAMIEVRMNRPRKPQTIEELRRQMGYDN